MYLPFWKAYLSSIAGLQSVVREPACVYPHFPWVSNRFTVLYVYIIVASAYFIARYWLLSTLLSRVIPITIARIFNNELPVVYRVFPLSLYVFSTTREDCLLLLKPNIST